MADRILRPLPAFAGRGHDRRAPAAINAWARFALPTLRNFCRSRITGAPLTRCTASGTRELPSMPKMSLIDLKALLSAERYDALSAMAASKLSDERASALNYYMGNMSKDMPAPDGRSKAVSFDVADTIEGLMPPLMDIFASGEDVVQFAPVGPEDVAAAEQETDYVNHVFMQQNNGFLVLYSFIKDELLSPKSKAPLDRLRQWRGGESPGKASEHTGAD